jgi:cell division protein FtsN
MKWLFSILLIANIGILIWSYPQNRHDGQERQALEQIGDLRLINEPPTDQAAMVGKDAGKPESPSPESVTENTTPPDDLTAHTEIAEKPLLEEMPAQQPQPPEAEKAVPEAVAVAKQKPQCETIGVFEKRTQAELLSVQLRALGLKPDIASETTNEQAGFWVLIPPQSSRDQAIGIAHKLEAAGVEDLWRFTSGNLAHAISLGLFRDEERALARRNKIAALGFNPEVTPRYRESTQYWLRFQYTGESPITTEKWQDFKQTFPDIERSRVDCQ